MKNLPMLTVLALVAVILVAVIVGVATYMRTIDATQQAQLDGPDVKVLSVFASCRYRENDSSFWPRESPSLSGRFSFPISRITKTPRTARQPGTN